MTTTDPDAIGVVHEAGLSAAERRARGVHFTPPAVADHLAALALDGMSAAATVCDPACGAGAMLLAAGRALAARGGAPATIAAEQLWGVDHDAATVAAARGAIVAWSGVDPGGHLVVGDGLRAGEQWPRLFDAVLGNPPFLNQLQRATRRATPVPDALAACVRPYTDTAWLFLAAAPALVRAGGRVVLIQPQSIAAARDAAPVRAMIERDATVEALWSTPEQVFAANVRVCAPILRVGAPTARPTRSWSALLDVPDGPPPAPRLRPGRTLGDIATATAGFRDEYYGVVPHVVDDREGDAPQLITTALIEPGRLAWGERPARIAGRKLAAPRVDLDALEQMSSQRVVRWVRARLVPKVLVATQTRVVEAAPDPEGTTVPLTPVISIEGGDPWLVAAALTAPPISAWALTEFGGTALSPGAIKLAARHLRDVALPPDERRWREGATLLERGEVARAAEVLNAAHGGSDAVFEWWARRARLAT